MIPEALLLDLDGTLYVGDVPLPGAVEAVETIVKLRIPRRFLTNTTRLSRRALTEKLQSMGFPINVDEIFTTPVAATRWLRDNEVQRIALFVPEAAREDFAELEVVEDAPQAVVVGDLGEGWTFALLNAAFRHLLGGAKLLALQKNRYWKASDGLMLDAGPFVAALEYAAQRQAVIIGKPSGAFFEVAAASLGTDRARIAVVGDDVESDIAGAQAAGLHAALVRTGKFREETVQESGIEPDWVADSLRDLIDAWYSKHISGS